MRTRDARIAELRGGGGPRALARLQGGRMPGEMMAPAAAAPRVQPRKAGNPFLRFGVLALLIAALFLPYHYEPGGPVVLMPMQQQEVHVEISGIIDKVNYNGGETVPAGAVIAQITSLEEQKSVQSTRAEIAEKEAELDELLSTPRPEDVALALSQLQTARTSADFSRKEAERLEPVYKAGHISLEDFDDARRQAEVDAQQVIEAEANLRKVRAGPHPKEIEALGHEIEGLKDELAYHESELAKSEIYMPFDGRIVTINLRDRIGQYLDKGALFATVENISSVRVEFDFPQSEVSEISVGGAVRIKLHTYPDRIFTGQVVDIAPAVAEEEFGRVVKVNTLIPNPDGVLKSGMTGYGKIDGGTKPVIIAFSRAIVRFFRIEVWSWLP